MQITKYQEISGAVIELEFTTHHYLLSSAKKLHNKCNPNGGDADEI